MKALILIVLVVVVVLVIGVALYFFSRNLDTNTDSGSIGPVEGKTNGTGEQKQTSTIGIPTGKESEEDTVITNTEEELPPGSIAIFYNTVLSAEKDKLKGYQKTSHSESIFETGFDINIDVESTSKGVIRYIPSVDWFDIVDTTTSYSYSEASIKPLTLDGRVFIAKTRGDRLKTTTITEIDPKNAESKKSATVDGVRFAIIGDNVYYRERINEDFYGKYSSGGELMKVSFGGSPEEVLPYSDPDNRGDLYSAGNSLLSVTNDFDTQTDTIRQHDPNTGKVIRVIASNIPTGSYISGDDALYQLVSVGTTYWISRYPVQGEGGALLQFELEAGDKGLSIDEDKGKILIATYGNDFSVIQLQIYDIETDELKEIEIEEFGSGSGLDYQFIFLN